MALHASPLVADLAPLASIGPALEALSVLAILVGAAAAILLNTAILNSALSGGEQNSRVERRNCPACGAPTDATSDVCEYCNEPLPGEVTAESHE